MLYSALNQLLGNIDLYLLDQILKGRYEPTMRILDAGCGEGRNAHYFIRTGYDIWGLDQHPTALRLLRLTGKSLHPDFDPEKFIQADLTDIPFPDDSFDALIACSVLHFAPDEAAFRQMMDALCHVLKPSGSLFIRMATNIGQADPSSSVHQRADGEPSFLLTQPLLDHLIEHYQFDWLEPLRIERVANRTPQIVLMLEKR